jgi:DNA segregation ATPase FtsK/SpoIIIE-like protein
MNEENLNLILESFKIKAICVGMHTHRHFAYYDLKLSPGTKVNKIIQFSQEIALAMKSKNAPIIKVLSEEGIIRLQVSYGVSETIFLEDLFNKNGAVPSSTAPFLLGETDLGDLLFVDMAKNSNILIGGATGFGKSSLLHCLIYNVFRAKSTKLYLIDTKKVEFGIYDDFRCKKVIANIAKDYYSALNMLKDLDNLMEKRYNYLYSVGHSNIKQCSNMFNKLVLIIDEAADLILFDKSGEFQSLLIKLTSKSRAAGINIIMATQHPSASLISGEIKANFNSRIALKTASRIDSRIILDAPGAENICNKGEALLKDLDNDLTRFQVGYVNPVDTIKNL